MTATITQARDDIIEVFLDTWDADAVPVRYDDAPGDVPTSTSTSWARLTLRFAEGGQTGFGGSSRRRYERRGIVVVQIFTPVGAGAQAMDVLVETALNAFEGKSSARGVWFRRVRPVSVDPDGGPWFQMNVIADFVFTEVR